ncbi:MAG TPA: ABC transporter substrate-binding protein [Acidobacteriaceae bacterium]|nr:ABC transporter substrate-binding protein [Acidobacteriaceae bacterium]
MSNRWLVAAACLCAAGGVATALCQKPKQHPAARADQHAATSWCQCGAHPPGPERDWTATPYANAPADMSPYAKFVKPYSLNYLQPTIFTGPGRNAPDPQNLTEVRIGFVGPIAPQDPDHIFGMRMLHGAQLAVEQANARGGYGGKLFRLMLHDDYNNWQESAVAGSVRPTNPEIWGSASDAAVKMIYDDKDWAIFGSISSEATHIMLRVALKAEIPIVNSASTDPTIPETSVPWYFTDLQDDRVQSYTLARRIYTELGFKRVAILRINNRYGRMGVPKFRDASRRLGHPVVIEQKFMAGDTDFSRELRNIQDSRADAIVLWTDEIPAAMILKQMRAMGMTQRVFGSYRTLGSDLLAQAGSAAEGFEAVFPYDPTRTDSRLVHFNRDFEARFHEKPEQFAALAYDAMNMLLDSICKAGLNRIRIQDALDNIRQYDGVTGHMVFDPNEKNVTPMYIGTVHDGAITYQLAPMAKQPAAEPSTAVQAPGKQAPAMQSGAAAPTPYARVGEDGVTYLGPARPDLPRGAVRVVLFGPQAEKLAQSAAIKAQLAHAVHGDRPWTLIPVDSGQNWGAAATQLVHALLNQHALAIIALDRNAAHLSEQLALKTFVPVVALCNDTTLTSANVPWIFRLPAGTAPVTALRLLEDAERRGGPNPQRVRAVLASGTSIDGQAFLPTGDPHAR